MPSKFNSNITKNLSKQLSDNLGIKYLISPIQKLIDLHIEEIFKTTWIYPNNLEIENIQARIRWNMLMDLSANKKTILSVNSNKDEIWLWYSTIYGDTNGAIAIIGDLHKTQIWKLSKYVNKLHKRELIPRQMIELKPSAELSKQQDVNIWWWDPFNYEFVSRLMKFMIEKYWNIDDVLDYYNNWTIEKHLKLKKPIWKYFKTKIDFIDEVKKIFKLKQSNYFKRIIWSPIITINNNSFWFDYREAQIS